MINKGKCFHYSIQPWNGYNDIEAGGVNEFGEKTYVDTNPLFPLLGITIFPDDEWEISARWNVAGKHKEEPECKAFYYKYEDEMKEEGYDEIDAAYVELQNPSMSVNDIFKKAYEEYMGIESVKEDFFEQYSHNTYLLDFHVFITFQNHCKYIEREFLEACRSAIKHNREILDKFEERLSNDGIVVPHGHQYSQYAKAAKAAEYHLPVFIQGETGTGKESMALTMHKFSKRKGAFVAINCSAIPESLIESELFGHVKGAFTGALKEKVGKISQANNGTLFLDEIGDVPHSVQVKLLRVLQEREIQKLGSFDSEKIDVLLVTATNKNVEELVAEGRIREDFYYRVINYLRLELKPLRKLGSENIIKIALFVLKDIYEKENKRRASIPELASGPLVVSQGVSKAFKNKLCSHTWPGNIRELRNYLHLVAAMSRFEPTLLRTDMPFLRTNKLNGSSKQGDLTSIAEGLANKVIDNKDSLLSILGQIEEVATEILLNECLNIKGGKTAFATMLGRHSNDKKVANVWARKADVRKKMRANGKIYDPIKSANFHNASELERIRQLNKEKNKQAEPCDAEEQNSLSAKEQERQIREKEILKQRKIDEIFNAADIDLPF